MADSSWINKIIYKKDGDQTGTTFPIGTTFDKVYQNESNHFSLQNLADILKQFFNRQAFMLYSETEPTIYSRTMEWYALSGDTADVDSALIVTEQSEQIFN